MCDVNVCVCACSPLQQTLYFSRSIFYTVYTNDKILQIGK